jgi:alpha-mannosidase
MCDETRDRIKEGRWEIVGGMWVEPDLNMPDGESQVRQLLVGQQYFKNEFGVTTRIGWNPDSFGYNWQLPQIYKRSGIDYFVTQKIAWNDTNQLPLKLFWWQSPDGSRVLTYFPHDYVNDIEPVRLANDIAKARTLNPGLPEMMHLYGIGDHGGGPTRAMLDAGLLWMQPDTVFASMRFGTAQGYFSSIEGKLDSLHSPVWNYTSAASGNNALPDPPAGKIALPVWNDELYLETHRGTYTTQSNHKRNMRESEEWLLNAEKYASIAWLYGQPYPAAPLTDAWKKALFNQFHDIAAGSGEAAVYHDAQKDYDQIRLATDDIDAKSLSMLDSEINTSAHAGVPVLILNPLGWERSGIVRVKVQLPAGSGGKIALLDAEGKPMLIQVVSRDSATNTFDLLLKAVKVPSIGYVVAHAVGETRAVDTDLIAKGYSLENSKLQIIIDPSTGCISHLIQKSDNFDFIAHGACGNQLQAFKDTPKNYDAWNIDAGFDQFALPISNPSSVKLIETGPLRSVIRITRSWQNSRFVQDVVLYAGADKVDIENNIDWHETHVLLKAAMPLAASSEKATFEIPYGTIDRPTTRNNSWEDAKFEVPALRWADLGDGQHGLALINESKYGYDAKGNVLRLSLLKSPTWPDPDADRGHHQFSYSLYPHSGTWSDAGVVHHGYDFNYKLTAHQVTAHVGSLPPTHSFFSVEPANIVLTAIKQTEDGKGLLFRYYDSVGKAGDVHLAFPTGATSAVESNLMEIPEGKPLRIVDGNKTSLPIGRYEIQSVRVEFAPTHHAVD